MRTKKGFNLRNICGEQIVVAEGRENIDFSKVICMNESAAFLWTSVQGKDFTGKELANLLTSEYDVDETTAQKDSEQIVCDWLKAGIIEL